MGPSSSACDPHELETILLEPYRCGTRPCIDSIFGPTAVPYLYWSASTVAWTPNFDVFAWGVSFDTGIVIFAYYFKPVPYGYVRAVR